MNNYKLRWNILVIITLLIVLVSSKPSFSAEIEKIVSNSPLTVDELIQKALKVNPSFRSVWEEQTLVNYTLYRAYGEFLPNLDFSSSYSATEQLESHFKSGTSRHGIGISYTLWDGGARYGTLRNAKLAIKASPYILTKSEQQISYSIKQTYNNALASFELVRAARSAVNLRRELLKLAETKLNLGATTEIEVLSTKVQLGTAENNLIAAIQDSSLSRQKLNQSVGIALTSEFPLVQISDSIPVLIDVEQLVEQANMHSPNGILNALELQRAKNNQLAANASWYPTLSLEHSLSYSEPGTGMKSWVLGPDEGSSMIAISMRYPLFAGFQKAEFRERSKVDSRKTKWSHQETLLEIEKSVRENYARLVQATSQIKIAEGNMDLAKRQRELQQERYRVGAATLLEVQTSQNDELNAEIEWINKRLTARTAKALLELSVGGSITTR